jgi:hypothetical protein
MEIEPLEETQSANEDPFEKKVSCTISFRVFLLDLCVTLYARARSI